MHLVPPAPSELSHWRPTHSSPSREANRGRIGTRWSCAMAINPSSWPHWARRRTPRRSAPFSPHSPVFLGRASPHSRRRDEGRSPCGAF
jgi:hypothetical protein